MSHLPHRRVLLLLAPALIVASLALAACGSSSGSSSTGAAAATGAAAGGPGTPGGSGRFAAIRACLQKQGINLPQRPQGQRGDGAGQPGGPGRDGIFGGAGAAGATGPGGPRLPAGVTRAQFRAAMQKCGLRRFGQGGFRNNPAFRQSLTTFAACMRQNGVNLPAPNTSGNGPVFNTKGIDTRSSQFQAALAKCRSNLRGRFGGPPGAGGPPPAGGSGTFQPGSTTGAPTPSSQ